MDSIYYLINSSMVSLMDLIDFSEYKLLIGHYKQCLENFRATPQGADWPNAVCLGKRFYTLLDKVGASDSTPKLLDLAHGYGAPIDHLQANQIRSLS